MEKTRFKTLINATPEKVWKVLWDEDTYRQWTSVFCEGSYAEGDWKQGSKILFLSPGRNGMTSIITVKKPNEQMSFKHLGEVKNGIEDLNSEEVKKWSGAMEEYFLREINGQTELITELDLSEEHKAYFESTFPKALVRIKELAEQAG